MTALAKQAEPLRLSPEQVSQAQLTAVLMCAKRVEQGVPASSAWSQLEADRKLIDALSGRSDLGEG